VKQKIQEKQGYHPDHQKLIFAGGEVGISKIETITVDVESPLKKQLQWTKKIPSSKTLADYGITKEDTLHLCLPLPGGLSYTPFKIGEFASSKGFDTEITPELVSNRWGMSCHNTNTTSDSLTGVIFFVSPNTSWKNTIVLKTRSDLKNYANDTAHKKVLSYYKDIYPNKSFVALYGFSYDPANNELKSHSFTLNPNKNNTTKFGEEWIHNTLGTVFNAIQLQQPGNFSKFDFVVKADLTLIEK